MTMITPDKSAAASAPSSSSEQCVPLAALAVDGTNPAAGDAVEYKVQGKIARIDGDHAYVTPETINDQPAAGPAADDSPEGMSDEDMMSEAKKADAESAGMGY